MPSKAKQIQHGVNVRPHRVGLPASPTAVENSQLALSDTTSSSLNGRHQEVAILRIRERAERYREFEQEWLEQDEAGWARAWTAFLHDRRPLTEC